MQFQSSNSSSGTLAVVQINHTKSMCPDLRVLLNKDEENMTKRVTIGSLEPMEDKKRKEKTGK